MRQRGRCPLQFPVGPDVCLGKVVADVAGSGERIPRVDRPLADRHDEPFRCVRGEPGRHETAVGPAHHAHPLGVAVRPRQGRIEQGQNIVDIDRAQATDHRPAVTFAISRRPAGITQHDRVPRACVDLGLVEECRAVGGERTAVHHQQHRMRTVPLGRNEPAVHRVTVRRRRGELDGGTDPGTRQVPGEVRQLLPIDPRSVIGDLYGHHLARPVAVRDHGCHGPPAYHEGPDDGTLADHHREAGQLDVARGQGNAADSNNPAVHHRNQHPIPHHLGPTRGPLDVNGGPIGEPARRAAGQGSGPDAESVCHRVDPGELRSQVHYLVTGHHRPCRRSTRGDDDPAPGRRRRGRQIHRHVDSGDLVGQLIHPCRPDVEQAVGAGEERVGNAGWLGSELNGWTTGEFDDEQLGLFVDDKALAVQPVGEPGDPPRRFDGGGHVIVGAVPARFRHGRDVGDPAAVRGEYDRSRAEWMLGDPARFAAVQRHREQLRRTRLGRAPEHDLTTVGAGHRIGVARADRQGGTVLG